MAGCGAAGLPPGHPQALTPVYKNQRVPGNFGYQRRAVALDMLLEYEVEHRASFGHVLMVRPDEMYPPLLDPIKLAHMWTVRDAVVFVNDQLAVSPRPLAGYVLGACLMNRLLFGGDRQAWPPEALRRLRRSLVDPSPGGLVGPIAFLAYHGCLFGGVGLEFHPRLLPWVDERGTAHAVASENLTCAVALIRQLEPRDDLAAAEGEDGAPACLRRKENSRTCLKELGLTREQLGICEEMEARRPPRPREDTLYKLALTFLNESA